MCIIKIKFYFANCTAISLETAAAAILFYSVFQDAHFTPMFLYLIRSTCICSRTRFVNSRARAYSYTHKLFLYIFLIYFTFSYIYFL